MEWKWSEMYDSLFSYILYWSKYIDNKTCLIYGDYVLKPVIGQFVLLL